MLVLSRKVGERVVIGDRIVVTVLEVKGRQVRLGFEAPPVVQIWRGELLFHDHTKNNVGERELAGAEKEAHRRHISARCEVPVTLTGHLAWGCFHSNRL